MAKEIDSQQTKRAMAFELWMSAPNPKVTFFKTLDVTPLVRISKKKNLKFNILLDYCWKGGHGHQQILYFTCR